MGQINSIQGFPQLKNNHSDVEVYFALESIRADYGGPVRSITSLMNCLSESGFKVQILQTNYRLRIDHQSYFPAHYTESLWYFIFKHFSKKKFNPIVVFNNQWTPSVQFLALFLILFKKKYFWYIRGSLKQDSLKKKIVWNISQKYLLRKAQFILVSSQPGKNSVLLDNEVPESKVIVVPNIVKLKFNESSRSFFKATKSSRMQEFIRIVYIGRIHRKKKVHEIIHNLDKKNLSRPVVLTVAGYCDDDLYLEELKESAKLKQIKLNLFVNITEEQKFNILYGSDVFISMSDRENFGIAIFEALWSGLCVIVNENIDFWPSSGMEAVFAVKPEKMTFALEKIVKLDENVDRNTRSNIFKSSWVEIQKESERKITNLFKENRKSLQQQ